MTKEVYYKLNKQNRVWIGYNAKEKSYLYDIYVKVPGGVKHLVYWFQGYNPEYMIKQAHEIGYVSPRPYKLAQNCDGSIDSPVHALLIDFCEKRGINLADLYNEAYPDEDRYSEKEMADIKKFGEWQGVEYPGEWNRAAVEGLIESLTEINNHSLSSLIDEKYLN